MSSSLAGALTPSQPASAPAAGLHPYAPETHLSGDVDMQTLSPDTTWKHDEESGAEQDQEMGDLFDDGDAQAATADL